MKQLNMNKNKNDCYKCKWTRIIRKIYNMYYTRTIVERVTYTYHRDWAELSSRSPSQRALRRRKRRQHLQADVQQFGKAPIICRSTFACTPHAIIRLCIWRLRFNGTMYNCRSIETIAYNVLCDPKPSRTREPFQARNSRVRFPDYKSVSKKQNKIPLMRSAIRSTFAVLHLQE